MVNSKILLYPLYVYYFIEVGKLQNIGLVGEDFLTRVVLTAAAIIFDSVFLLINIVAYVVQNVSLNNFILELSNSVNLDGQWCTVGFKYFIISFFILEFINAAIAKK